MPLYTEFTTHQEQETSAEYKAYRRRWEQNPSTHCTDDFPIHLDVELTTFCNLQCSQKICTLKCPDNLPGGTKLPEAFFDIALYKKMVDEGVPKGLCSLKLNYRGEPLLHPQVSEFVRYAKQRGVLEVMLNTNGLAASQSCVEKLVKAGLDKLFCTFVSPAEAAFDSIRGAGVYKKVVKNLHQISEIKKNLNTRVPRVILQVVDTHGDVDTDSLARDWKDVVDAVAIDRIDTFILDRPWKREPVAFSCAYLWQRLFILYNGDVVMCCGNHTQADVLGNIAVDSIESIWKGEKLNNIRDQHRKNRSGFVPLCSCCGFRKLSLEPVENRS